MSHEKQEDELLRAVALQNAQSIYAARQRAEQELRDARDELERKAAELQQQREWFRVTLSSIGDAVITTDVRGRITFLNPVAEALTGWTSAEASGQDLRTVFKIVNEETRQPAPNPVDRVRAEGKIIALANHTVLISRDGRETAIEDSAAPIRDASGRMTGIVMVFHDVTERRKAEAELKRNEQLLTDFFENAAVGLHWAAPDGTILRANRTELEMLGYAKEEYVGHNIAEFHVDQPVGDDILKKLTSGDSLHNYEARLRCKDGSIRQVLVSSNILSENGKFVHTRCFTRDVTEQKESHEVRDRLAAVVESSDDAILSKTLDGIITTWNTGAERMFGYKAEEVIGKPVTILMPPDRVNEEPAILQRLRRGERIDHYETIRRRKDGRLLNISLSVSPVRDANGNIIGAAKIAHDITDRIHAETALREAQEKLSRHAEDLERQVAERTAALQQTVGELEAFSYSISHDLRAPLRAMQSFARILAEECGPKLGPEGQDHIRRITTAAERMDRLIKDVLAYSRVARAEIQFKSVPLDRLLRDLIESYPDLKTHAPNIQLKGPFPSVLANEPILTQCIANLLGNAVKFVATGVTPQVEVWAETSQEKNTARLLVKDNGIGIDPLVQDKIFGIFERGSTQYEGTGIGLAIVKKGIERLGGRVGLQSKPAHGSTFWLELPLAN